ncbi:unnamed protein product, partial [Brugia timori]|uniref:Uncharacterized protein n=1 Tax=Brugia timori TaxID=42155 RepID=A0A0R3R191_9BILA
SSICKCKFSNFKNCYICLNYPNDNFIQSKGIFGQHFFLKNSSYFSLFK